MPRAEEQLGFLPSILDRLLDPEASGVRRGYTVEQMMEAVRRDLENLLNTRRTVEDWPKDFVEMSNSILAYGLPDLTGFNLSGPQDCAELCLLIAGIIARFEPRLRDVQVTLADGADGKTSKVRFHIKARLRMEPALPVGFETVLDVPAGHAAVLPSES